MTRKDEILAILGKYRVQGHYQASREAGAARYAVYVGAAEQVTEPKKHGEALAEARQLTASEIMALWE